MYSPELYTFVELNIVSETDATTVLRISGIFKAFLVHLKQLPYLLAKSFSFPSSYLWNSFDCARGLEGCTSCSLEIVLKPQVFKPHHSGIFLLNCFFVKNIEQTVNTSGELGDLACCHLNNSAKKSTIEAVLAVFFALLLSWTKPLEYLLGFI